jgi:nitroimidazol reductase NimA-like FMN-containing flavoprotein (pyridoxamine 5'-phosphate oxidase superfamily)
MSAQEPYAVVELSETESWTLIREAVVGRLAVIIDDQPEIFPVNHLVDLGSVVFRTGLGTKLTGAVGHQVAFEVDGYDLETSSAWSVVVKGRATGVNRLDDALAVISLPPFAWHPAPKPHFVRIEPDSITGRWFEVSGGARPTVPPVAASAG